MTPIIDAHLHIYEAPSARYPYNPLYTFNPTTPAPVEMLLEQMSRAGVNGAILVQPSSYGYDHAYVVDCMARYPGRFGAVGLAPASAPDLPDRLAALAAQGIRGVRFYPIHEAAPSWMADGTLNPALERAASLGMAICFFIRWEQLPHLAALARAHPGCTIVVDHLGQPKPEQPASYLPVLSLSELANVHVKVSDFPSVSREPYPYADLYGFVRDLYAAFGANRLMWGSNFPHIVRQPGYTESLGLVDLALPALPSADRAAILGGTAARLWNLAP